MPISSCSTQYFFYSRLLRNSVIQTTIIVLLKNGPTIEDHKPNMFGFISTTHSLNLLKCIVYLEVIDFSFEE